MDINQKSEQVKSYLEHVYTDSIQAVTELGKVGYVNTKVQQAECVQATQAIVKKCEASVRLAMNSLSELSDIIGAETKVTGYSELEALVMKSVAQRRVIRIEYVSKKQEVTVREIEPDFYSEKGYVTAWDRLRGDYRSFDLNSMNWAMLLMETYVPKAA